MDALEIGIQVRNIDAAEADDLIEDGRSRSRQYDVDRLIKESVRKTKKYRATLAKVLKKQNKLQKAENDFWDKIEEEQSKLDNPKNGQGGSCLTIKVGLILGLATTEWGIERELIT